MGKIYDDSIPTVIVETTYEREDFATKITQFLNFLHHKFITKEIVANLKFLLDGKIDGRSLAELIMAGLQVNDAAKDPRYLSFGYNLILVKTLISS